MISTQTVIELPGGLSQPQTSDFGITKTFNQLQMEGPGIFVVKYSSDEDPVRKWKIIKRVISLPLEMTHDKQPWVQLAGHQDSFAVGEEGTILKKLAPSEKCILETLMLDSLRPFVPNYKGVVAVESKQYIEMQDLLASFTNPCIMDCKMGVRTYLEEELAKLEKNTELRPDMYSKMVKVDPSEPTEEEHLVRAISKPRYMQWRERISSSATLGFRIEGIKNSAGEAFVDFQNCKDRTEIQEAIGKFASLKPDTLRQYLERLQQFRRVFEESRFPKEHEIIGSSLLFVHDKNKASVWMIDFGKTAPLRDGSTITHRREWERGNHEDGYLTGLDNIISIISSLVSDTSDSSSPNPPKRQKSK